MTHLNPQRHVVPTAVLTRSKLVPLTTGRPVTTVVPQPYVTRPRPAKTVVTKPHSPPRRTINRRPSPTGSNFPPQVTTIKAPKVNAVKGVRGNWHALKDKGVIDSGCSRHMKGNMSYLSDFEEINGGYVTFGGNPKGGKISGKAKIRTGKLEFDDVYFVKELKFNLFSVSQMCDKKNIVLFIDTKCIVLSPGFKLPDENQVLLRVHRENNMYNVDLKKIVLFGDLTCLFAKVILDESNLWHRRLGHINFKTMNKLVKGNLFRGLPSKVFKNNHTCVACNKGKEHRASCKTKPVSSVSQPLQRLHMDLFRPTFVKNLNKKSFCLVVTDDYSRFTWVFFLATKDETSPILKTFINCIENQLSLKVKIIRSDNGTEFKNQDLNQLCGMKGIKREFSVPRTPQQNGIAEWKNRTLIEAARTMLADSLLPIPFWAEAVNTACYVQNRVLVTKLHNKTIYELLLGRTPSIGFMRPFGCPVTILNTLYPLGKFDGKADEGFLVRYSISSKAFRVFNSRTQIVQETLHINFLENKPNVAGSGLTWLFDIDTLTKSMNYQPVTNTDGDAIFDVKEPEFEGRKPESEVHVSPSSSAKTKKHNDKTKRKAKGKSPVELSTRYRNLSAEFEDFSDNSINEINDINEINAASTPVPTVGQISTNSTNTFSAAGPSNTAVSPTFRESLYVDLSQYPNDLNMPSLKDITYSDDEKDVGAEADFSHLESTITVSLIPTTRVHKDHHVTQIIGYLSLATQTKSMTRMVKDQGGLTQINNEDLYTCMFACFLLQKEPKREEGINYEEVFARVARIEAIRIIKEEVYVCQPLGFENFDYPDKRVVFRGERLIKPCSSRSKKGNILMVKVYVDDIIFGSTNKDLCKAFEKLMKDKFQMSSMGELTFFLGLQVKQKPDGIFISQDIYVAKILRKFGLTDGKSASTPIDTEKPLLKDPDGEDVDVHTYRSMIGSLMYLTSSRPGIMFAPCEECREFFKVGDLSSHTTKYSSPALTQKVFTNIRRVGKGFSEVETPLFEGMLVPQQAVADVDDVVANDVDVDDVPVADAEPTPLSPPHTTTLPPPQELPFTSQVVPTPSPSPIAQPSSPPQQQQPSQPTTISMDLFKYLLETCTALTRRVENLEQDKIAQALKILNLKKRVRKLEKKKLKSSGLKRLQKVRTTQRIKSSADTVIDDQKDASKQGEIIANIDADEDVVLKDVDPVAKEVEIEKDADHDVKKPAELQEVIEVVTTAMLMTEVVTAATTPITAAAPITAATITAVPTTARRRKRVVIRDPEEIATLLTIVHSESKSKDKGKGILVEEPKPLMKQAQIEQDEAYARVLETEAHARKNMMIYQNMVGFKMDYFKGVIYGDIHLIFEKHFNSNMVLMEKSKEQLEEEASRALKRTSENDLAGREKISIDKVHFRSDDGQCKTNDIVHLQALMDRKKVIIIEDTVRQVLRLDDAESIDCLPNEEIFVQLAGMGYEKPSTKLTFYKAFFSAQWNLVRNVDSSSKLYMYPRFLQLMINAQVGDLSSHTTKYTSPALTQKRMRILLNLLHLHLLLHHHQNRNLSLQHHRKVSNLEHDKIAQALEITKLKRRVRRLEKKSNLKASKLTRLRKGRLEESQEKVYHLDLEHAQKFLSMQDDEAEPAELTEVKRKEKQDITVLKYQALKRKPQTKAQERKNMMVYLKNMAGFKMDFFKCMSYDDIRPIFEKHFNSIVAFLEKGEKELEEEASKQSKRKSETSEEKVAKKQKLNEEVEELKTHLQIVPNDEDDVYTEATPLALKVPVVDYQIHSEHNKPYYKIIRVDGTYQLFLSFISLLRNFDREDLEMLWQIIQEKFASLEPKNFSDDFLLNTLKIMFEKPDVEASIWKSQTGRYGLAKV
uniref:Putative ribonuclease H-like domain-containing protein n=1 Tax=Tanacetum cinerariifolium TaxID=118510 RepID=A0A6L2M9L4_TANCI|nr:putative ribonuclease H-like domain-containing protein [Tanacetum cinerariifolium]